MKKRGMVLVEMVAALLLLAAAMLVATILFSTATKVIGKSNTAMTETRAFDGGVMLLRKDVWAAEKLEQVEAQTVRVTATDGKAVIWSIDKNRVLTRTPGLGVNAVQTFGKVSDALVLSAEGAAVTIRSTDVARREASVTLPSQVILAGGGK